MLSNRATRIVAAAATAGLMFAGIAPATASADSFAYVNSSGFAASTAASSTQEEIGTVEYAAIGGTQAGGPAALSSELFGSLTGLLPGGGGNPGGGNQSGEAYANIALNCDQDGTGVVEYDNSQANRANTFEMRVDGATVDQQLVPKGGRVNITITGVTSEVEVLLLAGTNAPPMSIGWESVSEVCEVS